MRCAELIEWIILLNFEILHSLINLFILFEALFILHRLVEELFERSEEVKGVLFKLHT